MRILLLLLVPAAALLSACYKEPRPLRLDLIGSTRFTSSSRSASPGDTLSARIYSSLDNSNDGVLKRFRIQVTYEPRPSPRVYTTSAVLLTDTLPSLPVVYLDAVLTDKALREYVHQTTFGVRNTSGREKWEFTIFDSKQNTITRTFRLSVAKSDSLIEYHQYILRIPAAPALPARPFVALLPGLAFPASTVNDSSGRANQGLIDVVYKPGNASLEVYKNPNSLTELRATAFGTTKVDSVRFFSINTAALIATTFDNAQLPALATTGTLVRNQVIAFRTVGQHKGVFMVRRILQTPYPMLEILVRVRKEVN